MKQLVIDTSSHICAACVFETDTGTVLAQETHDIGRGHAEILMELIESVLLKSQTKYQDLKRIGVTIGPGSFTGVRVGMSVARGLALSLNVSVVGVSTLDGCLATARELGYKGNLVSLLDAKRSELYCKLETQEAFAASYDDIAKAIEAIGTMEVALCGSGASIFNEACQKKYAIIHDNVATEIEIIAKLVAQMPEPLMPPEPLYLRSADAKVQAGFALERA